jgi:hypothetical protein
MKFKHSERGDGEVAAFVIVVLVLIILIGLAMWILPNYGVYRQRLGGQALLAHAQSAKEVAVAEAKAKMESAELLAQAEVTRAKGVAQANQIIGESLRNNEAYLRYLWIIDVAGANVDKTVVYVPTESNLPILEAARHTIKAEK